MSDISKDDLRDMVEVLLDEKMKHDPFATRVENKDGSLLMSVKWIKEVVKLRKGKK